MLLIALEPQGQASLLSTDGERVELSSERAYPPGSTLSGTLVAWSEGVVVKVASCRKVGASFEIRGRLVSLPRPLRDRLLEHGAGSAGPS